MSNIKQHYKQRSSWDNDTYLDHAPDPINNTDAFPNDNSQWNDTDMDGFGDNPNGSSADAFRLIGHNGVMLMVMDTVTMSLVTKATDASVWKLTIDRRDAPILTAMVTQIRR